MKKKKLKEKIKRLEAEKMELLGDIIKIVELDDPKIRLKYAMIDLTEKCIWSI